MTRPTDVDSNATAPSERPRSRLRVLVSAYACQPGKGSEFGVGWNQVQQIARFHDVWVITRRANRKAIETALTIQPTPNVTWVYFDLPGCTRFWRRNLSVQVYYYLWQLAAYHVARRLHQATRFDLSHHVTFVKYYSPTFLAFLSVPFIWGPVGGGESSPPAFRKWLSFRGRFIETVRDLARWLGEADPLVRIAARRTVVALATTAETSSRLLSIGCSRVEVIPQVGLPSVELESLGKIPLPRKLPFRVVTIGRVLYWKGIELGVRAFAKFHERFPESEYWIIGDGSDRSRMERLASSMGAKGSVVFWGEMLRPEMFGKLAFCDVMLFPSLHDSGGWVCLEAMAARRPVVCLDLGGPALQVTSEVGITVPAISPSQAIADIAKALEQLALDPVRRLRLGEAARERALGCFNWDRKGEMLAALYSRLHDKERLRGRGHPIDPIGRGTPPCTT